MKKRIIKICVLLLAFLLCACGQEEETKGTTYPIYFVSNSETKIEKREVNVNDVAYEEQLEYVLGALSIMPAKLDYKAPFCMGFSLLDYEVEDGKITLNVSKDYLNLSVTTEVLVRGAIVKTLTGMPHINFVCITVEDEPLRDSLGTLVGWMNADQFIENDGSEFNSYEEVRLKLYFANETGDALIATTRTKEYNTNIAVEKLIIEELIKGPNAEGVYPTINPDTKVASVAVKDGVCYVNLDESFLIQPNNVTPEVTIYSIANSLIEMNNVNKVQISVNGDTSILYREKFSLTTYFERNLDMMAKTK